MARRLGASASDLLGFAESRTIDRFLAASGPLGDATFTVDLDTFLARQRLIKHPQV
jgi:hypothetical protein